MKEFELPATVKQQIEALQLLKKRAVERGVELATPKHFKIDSAGSLVLVFEQEIEVAFSTQFSKYRILLKLRQMEEILGFFDLQTTIAIIEAHSIAGYENKKDGCELEYPKPHDGNPWDNDSRFEDFVISEALKPEKTAVSPVEYMGIAN